MLCCEAQATQASYFCTYRPACKNKSRVSAYDDAGSYRAALPRQALPLCAHHTSGSLTATYKDKKAEDSHGYLTGSYQTGAMSGGTVSHCKLATGAYGVRGGNRN